MTTRELGQIGEEAVCAYLTACGYRICARNFTIRGGELDIVAEDDTYLAFVEVKARRYGSMVSGMEAVTRTKQGLLIRTAAAYLYAHPTQLQPRFDIAEVILSKNQPAAVDYLENAFDTTGFDVIF